MERKAYDPGMDAVYLAACALHGAVPQGDRDLDALLEFCKFHKITAMTAMALEPLWAPDDPAAKPWRQERDMAIRKNLLLNNERQALLAHMEKLGCWYLPLKGSVLQYAYPKFGMRQMGDNDILFDPAFRESLRDHMTARGYTVTDYGHQNHDEYAKAPVYNMELHVALFGVEYPALAGYYADVKSRLVKDPDNGFGCHFADEDFYIYITAHAYKHFTTGGTGIRHLVDTWVYLGKHDLDRDYVTGELEKLGAADFERQCRSLSRKLFDTPERPVLTEAETVFLNAFLRSGAYGTADQRVENALDRAGDRTGYVLGRLFLPPELLAVNYPVLNKHPWLYPLCLISRLFRALWKAPGRLLRELTILIKGKK